MRKAILGVVLSLAFAAVAATPASAENYCAGTITPPACTGPNTFGGDFNGIIDAMVETTNNAGPDKVFIGPGTYPVSSGLISTFPENVEVIGSGVDQTIFTSSTSSANYLDMVFADASSVIRGFTLNIIGAPTSAVGLRVSNGRAEDFKIVDQTAGSATDLKAISLMNGAKAVDFDVSVTGSGTGVVMHGGDAAIEKGRLVSVGQNATGVNVSGTAISNIANSSFDNFQRGISTDSGTIVLSDTAFDLGTNTIATGIYAYDTNNGTNPIDLELDRVTMYGDAGSLGNQIGIFVGADFATESVTASIQNSLLDFPSTASSDAIRCLVTASSSATVNVSTTAFNEISYIETIENCNRNFDSSNIDTTLEVPTYVDALNGDLRHAFDSPMIDRLDGSAITPGALDAIGSPRLTDGDGDCVAKLDIGAYEHLAVYPAGHPCNPLPPNPPPPISPTPIATAKLTTRAKKAFTRSKSGFRKRTNPRATAFGVTFKNAQVARFEIQQVLRGVKKGRKCKRGSTGGKRCNYFKSIPGIQRQDVYDGEIFYQFGGQIGGRKLKPGNYRVLITPFGEGAVVGTPIYVPFKLK